MLNTNSRRKFFAQSTAVAVGSLMVHQAIETRAGDSPNNRIQLGLIGCGGVLHGHVQRLQNHTGKAIDSGILGEIAYRTRPVLEFDPATEQITNSDEANAVLTKPYRPPYGLPETI